MNRFEQKFSIFYTPIFFTLPSTPIRGIRFWFSADNRCGDAFLKLLTQNRARNGVQVWQKEVDEIAARQMEAIQARSDSLDGVRMLAHWDLTTEVIKFDPHFPLVGNFMVPSAHETRLLSMLESLERTFLATHEKIE